MRPRGGSPTATLPHTCPAVVWVIMSQTRAHLGNEILTAFAVTVMMGLLLEASVTLGCAPRPAEEGFAASAAESAVSTQPSLSRPQRGRRAQAPPGRDAPEPDPGVSTQGVQGEGCWYDLGLGPLCRASQDPRERPRREGMASVREPEVPRGGMGVPPICGRRAPRRPLPLFPCRARRERAFPAAHGLAACTSGGRGGAQARALLKDP